MDPVLEQLGLEPWDLPRACLEELDRQGFTILPGIIEPAWRARLAEAFERLSGEEGDQAGSEVGLTPGVRRLSNLANKGEVFDRIYLHPALLRAVWHVLRRPFKLHSLNGHDPLPGRGEQQLHPDWAGDRTAFHVVNSMWMLDEFTAGNGATRVVPGTHLLPEKIEAYVEDRTAPREDEVQLTAPAGSVGIFNGSLWHSCSRNRTGAKRRTLHCAFIAREHPQQTDQKKYLRPETARRLSPLARYVLDV
ncbi:MAG: phytanoyl-CoA dioxygenase family protein [Gemmatimonadetes bacterium]|nr:phytanoyl-CoA dioxygenase family protein [Gemmatimonadota bacterium]